MCCEITFFPYCIEPSTRSLALFWPSTRRLDCIDSSTRFTHKFFLHLWFTISWLRWIMPSTQLHCFIESIVLGTNPLHWFVDSPFHRFDESISLSRQVDKIELTSRCSRVDESIQLSQRIDTIESPSQCNRVDESIKSIQWVDTIESTSRYNRVDVSI